MSGLLPGLSQQSLGGSAVGTEESPTRSRCVCVCTTVCITKWSRALYAQVPAHLGTQIQEPASVQTEPAQLLERSTLYIYIYLFLCELAQSGHRNNHKPTNEIQKVNAFLLPCKRGDYWGKQHQGRDTQTGMQALRCSVCVRPPNMLFSPAFQRFTQA